MKNKNFSVICNVYSQTQDEWDSQYLEFKGARVSYIRPVSLAQLLDLKAGHPEARIVAGNTEVGE